MLSPSQGRLDQKKRLLAMWSGEDAPVQTWGCGEASPLQPRCDNAGSRCAPLPLGSSAFDPFVASGEDEERCGYKE